MSNEEEEVLQKIEAQIGLFPDFPRKGILFRDVTPILRDPDLFGSLIDILCKRTETLGYKLDCILGIESRGFLFGPHVASKLKLPFLPLRKRGKLPGFLFRIEYDLEYGKDCLELQRSPLLNGSNCLIVDDLLATGGTMLASKNLAISAGAKTVACLVIIELKNLRGKDKLDRSPLLKLFSY